MTVLIEHLWDQRLRGAALRERQALSRSPHLSDEQRREITRRLPEEARAGD